jgi:xylulokinase
VRFRLTGHEGTDNVDAQGTLLFNTLENRWDERLCALIDLDIELLPDVAKPADVVGEITEEGAQLSGLEAGTPVIAGTTDTLLEVMASGAKRPGDCTVKLATFGRICVLADKPVYDERLITYSYITPGLWYPGTGTKSFASSLRWFRDQFCRDIQQRPDAFEQMEREGASVPPGADSVLFHPYLQGEGSPYNDPLLRGDFVGLTLHHTRSHLIRAVMEGTAFSLRDSINFLKQKGIAIQGPLRFIGGGTRGRLWPSILADVLGNDGVVPRATDPSLGAAMLAGVGTGIFSSVEEAQERVKGFSREIQFDRKRSRIYDELFQQYIDVHDRLVEINHRLSEISG